MAATWSASGGISRRSAGVWQLFSHECGVRGWSRRACPMLLAPKLRPPVPRDGYVRRDRLHDALSCASSTQVTLVSAPAGCGKTALVAAWLADLPTERWAWLSLDSRDDDMVRVWSYLIEALRSLADGVGDVTLHELARSGGRGTVERWLGSLLNDLAAVDRPTSYLVVDDLHVIADPEIRASVTLFVANMPPWLRLIIVTRADPPLPLPRLRAEGRLTEIRQSDLRFDASEAHALLRREGVEDLAGDQLQWLVDRTEGWAAGLQLAVIVLGDEPSAERMLEVAGSNRTFADYIVSEVIDVASDDMRRFLFTTSVLDRINPALARAVSGFGDAEQMLRVAQHRGLFLVALDERGEWYRYHALFAEAVQAEARSRAPELVQLANEQAATWFEACGDLVMAVDHWLAAGRSDEALRIAIPAAFQLFDAGQMRSIERIAALIPASVVGADAHRQLDYALLHHVVDGDVSRWWVNEAQATIAAITDPDEQLTRRAMSVRAVCRAAVRRVGRRRAIRGCRDRSARHRRRRDGGGPTVGSAVDAGEGLDGAARGRRAGLWRVRSPPPNLARRARLLRPVHLGVGRGDRWAHP